MGQLNRIPGGILGFLGIKNFGRSPSDLADILAGTWDLTDWYLANAAQYSFVSVSATTPGGLVVHTVPTGFVYAVMAWDHQIITDAGEALNWTPCQIAPGGTTPRVCYGPEIVTGASANVRYGADCQWPLIVMPGESLGLSCQIVTGTVSVNSCIRFVAMQA